MKSSQINADFDEVKHQDLPIEKEVEVQERLSADDLIRLQPLNPFVRLEFSPLSFRK